MQLVELTEFLVKSLVKDDTIVEVNLISDSNIKVIQVLVSSEDIGSLIGKNGMIANSIRTIVQASSYHNHLGRVRINFDIKTQ